MNDSEFSCSHFSQLNDPEAMSKTLMQEDKEANNERFVCKIETTSKNGVEDSQSVSNSAEFELISKSVESHSK